MIARLFAVLLTAGLLLAVATDARAQIAAGTVNAKQSGTWNVGNITGTITLPTGASTAAKQPALGTAGSASADVITIQGIASMTKLLVTPDSVALPANQSVNVTQVNGVTPLMGAGNTGTGSMRVTIASDQASIPVISGALASIGTFQQAVTASAVVLATHAAKRVCLKVLSAGTQVVYFGAAGVSTTTGQELSPGDAWCGPIDDSSRIFVIAGSTGSTVAVDYMN
jgi:hypothetical protein